MSENHYTSKGKLQELIDGLIQDNSSAVTSNRDGDLYERTEYIIDQIAGAPPVRTTQSVSPTVSEGTYGYFNVQIYDINGDPYLEADIDITLATLSLDKSTLGGAFSPVGITQPTLGKGLGHIDVNTLFKADEWAPDDLYRLTVTGAKVMNGVEHALQQFVWNNYVSIVNDIDAEVDAILEFITVPAIDNVDDESIADVVGMKGDTPKTDATATVMNNLKALFASSLSKRIRISEVVNPTSFKTTDLPALGTGGLIGWYVYCSLDAAGLGGAPQGEYRLISNWVNGASGTFTHEAFSVPLTTSDKVIIIHPSIYNTIAMMPEIAKIDGIKTTVDLITGYALDSTVAKDATVAKAATTASAANLALVKTETDKIPAEVIKTAAIKVETDKIPATITKIDTINTNTTPKRQSVYPTLADGVNITTGAGAWGLTANFVQVVPANTITSAFRIIGINPAVVSANDVYEIVLYSGTAGNEVEIGRTKLTKVGNNNYSYVSLKTGIIAANSRISAKVASSTGGDNVTISLEYLV